MFAKGPVRKNKNCFKHNYKKEVDSIPNRAADKFE